MLATNVSFKTALGYIVRSNSNTHGVSRQGRTLGLGIPFGSRATWRLIEKPSLPKSRNTTGFPFLKNGISACSIIRQLRRSAATALYCLLSNTRLGADSVFWAVKKDMMFRLGRTNTLPGVRYIFCSGDSAVLLSPEYWSNKIGVNPVRQTFFFRISMRNPFDKI